MFVDLDEVKEDSEVILILHIRGLKILKQYFYCDCYISQIKVFQGRAESKYTIMDDYALIDEDDIDDHIFDEEILNSFKSDEEEQLKKEEQLKEEQLKEEQLKKEKEEKIKQIQEEIQKKNEELEKLIN